MFTYFLVFFANFSNSYISAETLPLLSSKSSIREDLFHGWSMVLSFKFSKKLFCDNTFKRTKNVLLSELVLKNIKSFKPAVAVAKKDATLLQNNELLSDHFTERKMVLVWRDNWSWNTDPHFWIIFPNRL